ncbi:MAG: potassium channel family protein, partial [Gammaproteobacteria bacterium]
LLLKTTSSTISALCLLGTLLVSVWSLIDSRHVFRIGLALAGLATILLVAEWITESGEIRLATLVVLMAFLMLTAWHAGRDVLFGGVVDVNRLVGALCIYEMLGLIWAVLYACLVVISPSAFGDSSLNAGSPFWDFVYFSFVTITTLGYGDVSPVGAIAKSLAYMEALVGQFYIAVLIASLIGAHLESKKL